MRDLQADLKICEAARRPIPGCPGYEADELGRIWSVQHNWRGYDARPMVPTLDRYGYLKVRLTINGIRKKYSVHRLVCMAFHGMPGPGMVARHLNGVKTDNRPSNLAWGTVQDNERDSVRLGSKAKGDRNGARKYPERVSEGVRAWLREHPDKIRRGELQWKAKVSNQLALEIRKAYLNGERPVSIAKRLGLNYNTVYSICRGYNYGHLQIS